MENQGDKIGGRFPTLLVAEVPGVPTKPSMLKTHVFGLNSVKNCPKIVAKYAREFAELEV